MNRLVDIGFVSVGSWTLNDEEIEFDLLESHKMTTDVLYSFISNDEIKYIGKTKMKLSQRMYHYKKPGPTQSTNIRVNSKIKELLERDQYVKIYIRTFDGLLRFGNYKINLAAGLEDSLIDEIDPEWNLR